MMKKLSDVFVSVLDLATIAEGETPADAFRRSEALAKRAEELGFIRYWFAEHHNMESVASAATSVLIGHIASVTSKMRIGAGGVMLPNHAPLIIAEQFGTLAWLYPGRIDLGIGRAPGTDPVTSYALRRSLKGDVDDFPRDVIELINYLGPRDEAAKVRAIPGEETEVPVWLLGSSTYSAQLAAALGLPFGFASHFAPTYLEEALSIYRDQFQPSKFLQRPYSLACINVITADSNEKAQHLATSFYQLALGMVRNKRRPVPPPIDSMDDVWSEAEKAAIQQMMRYSFVGDTKTVNEGLQLFTNKTNVNEIMVASHIYNLDDKLRCYELIAPLFKSAGS